jgi:hypothetical protein
MPITFNCTCGKTLRVKDELAGKRVRCPDCQAIVNAPEPELEVGIPLEDDPPPPKPAARPAVVEDEDDEPRPAKAKAKKADEGYDLDDEDEERTSNRPKIRGLSAREKGWARDAEEKKPSPFATIAGLVGAGVGVGVGKYAGPALLFPGGFALLAGWIFSKTAPQRCKPMVPAAAVHAGHGLWMLLAMIILAQFDLTLIDFAILMAGAIWLAYAPSLVAVVLLCGYQAIGLVLNGMAFGEAKAGTDVHKGLLVHLVLRATAIVLMIYGLVEIARQRRKAAAADEDDEPEPDHID